jgi:hypothetical protein
LNALDLQSRAAVGNADRAEGLLVAFAARRALDSGVPLGYIEGLIEQRFGASQRQAVATILTAARTPVTLQELQEGLQQVGPQLLGGGPNQSWWSSFRNELGGLVVIRKAGTPSPLPAEILRRATQRLEAGQVKVALAEVLRLPDRDKASDWIGKARRYIAARNALDQIEASALLAPSAPLPPAAPARQPTKAAAPTGPPAQGEVPLDFQQCVGPAEHRLDDELRAIEHRHAPRGAAGICAAMGMAMDYGLDGIEAVDGIGESRAAEEWVDFERLAGHGLGNGRIMEDCHGSLSSKRAKRVLEDPRFFLRLGDEGLDRLLAERSELAPAETADKALGSGEADTLDHDRLLAEHPSSGLLKDPETSSPLPDSWS